jgi:hypothetical protein
LELEIGGTSLADADEPAETVEGGTWDHGTLDLRVGQLGYTQEHEGGSYQHSQDEEHNSGHKYAFSKSFALRWTESGVSYTRSLIVISFIEKDAQWNHHEHVPCNHEVHYRYHQVQWQHLILWSHSPAVRDVQRDEEELGEGEGESDDLYV